MVNAATMLGQSKTCFQAEIDNVWTVRLDNPEIVRNSRIVLRVGCDMSEKMLRTLFVETPGAAYTFGAPQS